MEGGKQEKGSTFGIQQRGQPKTFCGLMIRACVSSASSWILKGRKNPVWGQIPPSSDSSEGTPPHSTRTPQMPTPDHPDAGTRVHPFTSPEVSCSGREEAATIREPQTKCQAAASISQYGGGCGMLDVAKDGPQPARGKDGRLTPGLSETTEGVRFWS